MDLFREASSWRVNPGYIAEGTRLTILKVLGDRVLCRDEWLHGQELWYYKAYLLAFCTPEDMRVLAQLDKDVLDGKTDPRRGLHGSSSVHSQKVNVPPTARRLCASGLPRRSTGYRT